MCSAMMYSAFWSIYWFLKICDYYLLKYCLYLILLLLSFAAAAAAKSLQWCPTLCDPIDGRPPGSPTPGILQARTLEWVAFSFSNACKWKVKVKSLSCVRLLATPWTAAYQAPPPIGFSSQEYWSGVHLPSLLLYQLQIPIDWLFHSDSYIFTQFCYSQFFFLFVHQIKFKKFIFLSHLAVYFFSFQSCPIPIYCNYFYSSVIELLFHSFV